jgi:hypothetical protein
VLFVHPTTVTPSALIAFYLALIAFYFSVVFSFLFFDAGAMKVSKAVHSILLVVSGVHVSAQTTTPYSISTFDQTQVTGLSPACANVYSATIPNCVMTDFLPTIPCSSVCLTGLQSIQSEAQAACAGSSLPSTSVLNLFVNGQGIQELCTTQKLASNTLTTSMASNTSMAASTATAMTSTTTTPAMLIGGETSISLPPATVIAIVVTVVVLTAILIVVGTILFRKNYTGASGK